MTAIGKLNPNSTMKDYRRDEIQNTEPIKPIACKYCGELVESKTMLAGVCYDCYRDCRHIQTIAAELDCKAEYPVTFAEPVDENEVQAQEAAETNRNIADYVDAAYMQDEPGKSFAEYMATDYIVEKERRAEDWRKWKEAHPNSSPYHF